MVVETVFHVTVLICQPTIALSVYILNFKFKQGRSRKRSDIGVTVFSVALVMAAYRRYASFLGHFMPHITLLYPFRPSVEFERVASILARACVKKAPIEVRLQRFA